MKFNPEMCLCIKCQKAGVVEKVGKFGRFYVCSDKACTWKVSVEKMLKLIENKEIKEMTQTELFTFLTTSK